MRIYHWIAVACGTALAVVSAIAADPDGSTAAASNPDALAKFNSKRFDEVYVRPDADFRSYTKVLLRPTQVTFAPGWMKDMNSARIALLQRTTTEDADRIAEEVRTEFSAVVTNAFKRAGYAIVTTPAANVLQLSVNIVDLYVSAPETITMALPSRVYTANAGQATVAIEFRDSTTDALLGRIRDHRTAGDRGGFRSSFMLTTPVSNRFDFGRVFNIRALGSARTLMELKSPLPVAMAVPGRLP